MRFRFLDSITADAGFIVYGKTENELFENASLALFSIMCDLKGVGPKNTQTIQLNRSRLDELLFDYLNELIFLKDKDAMLLSKFDITIHKNSKYSISARLRGERIDRERHELKVDVKAVTKHDFKVEKTKVGYKANVIVDI